MAEPRGRDHVWMETIEQLLRDEEVGTNSVTPEYIANETPVSERTARDCLKAMADRGFVEGERIPDGSGRIRYVAAGLLLNE